LSKTDDLLHLDHFIFDQDRQLEIDMQQHSIDVIVLFDLPNTVLK